MFVKDIPRGATSYTASLDKLRQGVTYEFRVVAVNQVGYGEPSSPPAAVSGRSPARESRGDAPPSGAGRVTWSHGGGRRTGARLPRAPRSRPCCAPAVLSSRLSLSAGASSSGRAGSPRGGGFAGKVEPKTLHQGTRPHRGATGRF